MKERDIIKGQEETIKRMARTRSRLKTRRAEFDKEWASVNPKTPLRGPIPTNHSRSPLEV